MSDTLNDEVVKAYRELMNSPDTPPHLRLGAANKLSAHLAAIGAAAAQEQPTTDQAPDPMADLDELEVGRRKRARR